MRMLLWCTSTTDGKYYNIYSTGNNTGDVECVETDKYGNPIEDEKDE